MEYAVFTPFELPTRPRIPPFEHSIVEFGARPADCAANTAAFRAAIARLTERGGGRLIVPGGSWTTGPIHLRSNVELHLAEGARVCFSRNFDDYLPVVFSQLAGIRCYNYSPMIYAIDVENVAITGRGVFDGQGDAWWPWKHRQPGMEDLMRAGREGRPLEQRVYGSIEAGARPRFLQILRSKNVYIEGITILNGPSWAIHPVWCENIWVRGVTVLAPADSHNTDGVNMESCRRALVEECFVETSDDAFCVKAGRDQDARAVGIPCRDIVFRRNRTGRNHQGGGIVVGSETSAGIENVLAHDCDFEGCKCGISMKTMNGRGGYIRNIEYRDLRIGTARQPGAIRLTMRYSGEPLDDQSAPIRDMPIFENVWIERVRCERAPVGFSAYGRPGYPIRRVTVANCDLHAERAYEIEDVENLTMRENRWQ